MTKVVLVLSAEAMRQGVHKVWRIIMGSDAPNKTVGINQLIPTKKIWGPGGEIVVNEKDAPAYLAQEGYSETQPSAPKGGDCTDKKHDWKPYELKDLRKHAKAAKLEFTNETTDEQLRNLLCTSGYVPA